MTDTPLSDDVVERLVRLVWLLRRNLEDEDRRMAVENCNRLICLLETGETPDDMDTLRAIYRTISARLADGSGEGGNSPTCERVALLTALEAARYGEMLEAANGIIERMSSTYKSRNGREMGIQGDDGEKCWIVHSDDIERLRALLSSIGGV